MGGPTSEALLRALLIFAAAGACRSLHDRRHARDRASFLDEGSFNLRLSGEANHSVADKPQLNTNLAKRLIKPLARLAPQDCGKPLLTSVQVDDAVLRKPKDYFAKGKVEGTWYIFAAGSGWDALDSSPFRVMQGHRLVKVNAADFALSSGVASFAKSLAKGDTLTFEVGLDLRRCWGPLQDDTGADVCGEGALARLRASMSTVQANYDKIGKSKSSIVENLDGFIIKSLDGYKQYRLLKQVMPAFRDSIESAARKEGRCLSTALAPICFALTLPQDGKAEALQWIAMRKVELSGQTPAHLQFSDGDQVKFFDLKGPKFSGVHDLKSYSGSSHVWHRKDMGFTEKFPQGLPLEHCGAREAALVLELDSALLARQQITDYSVLAQLYEDESGLEPRCACQPGPPRFPLVLHTKHALGAAGGKTLKLAVGVIDYLEQEVANLLKRAFSTMLHPKDFKSWWMRMWPVYFRLPPRRLELPAPGRGAARLRAEPRGIPAESVSVGDKVRALAKIKWQADTQEYDGSRLYVAQTNKTGSKRKVSPGILGRVVNFTTQGELVVKWESREDYYLVEPSQVVASPRRVLDTAGGGLVDINDNGRPGTHGLDDRRSCCNSWPRTGVFFRLVAWGWLAWNVGIAS